MLSISCEGVKQSYNLSTWKSATSEEGKGKLEETEHLIRCFSIMVLQNVGRYSVKNCGINK